MKSYLSNVDKLIGGDFREKEIYSLFGEASVGKSLYLIGEAISLMSQGTRVIWLDTEGGFDGLWEKFSPLLMQRFGVSEERVKELFFYKRVVTAQEFCKFFGFDLEVSYNKKVAIDINGWKEKDGEAYTLFGRMRGKMAIILDSFSSPTKMEIPTNVQNFSARADLQSFMILGMVKFMSKVGAFALMTSHESKNPTDIYHSNPNMRGGATVKYYSKHILYFERPKKKLLSDYRKITAVRTPVAKDWTMFMWAKVGQNGYEDTEDTEVEALLGKAVEAE